MDHDAYWKLVNFCRQPQMQNDTIEYLVEHLRNFVNKQERVLLCFHEYEPGNISWLMEQAVLRCGAIPVLWGPDHRWNTLLRQAFHSRATMIIGPPLVLLGLAKLRKHTNTPLYFRKAITAAYPCHDWTIEGIVTGLDCEAGGCFANREDGIVAGFACGHSWGVHLRSNVFGIEIVDDNGEPLPEGEIGQMVLYPHADPTLRYNIGDRARFSTEPCSCGSSTPRLLDIYVSQYDEPSIVELGQEMHKWTSILDCRIERSEAGVEIEIVCFPGEKLPKLPSAAKMTVRPYNPKTDEPFQYRHLTGNGRVV